MPRISQRTIDQVKEKAKIVDAFDGIELKRMGREFVARCPWHDDRKPSLSISPQKNFAYCHVCQHGVDALGWLQDRGATFQESIENLANRYNIQIQMEDSEDDAKFQALRVDRAKLGSKRHKQMHVFHDALMANREACIYLKGRGISKATAQDWKLGFIDDRLMVPLCDAQGRPVAFTGRALAGQMPKYKNSATDALYDKSRLIFGLDRAMGAIRKSREVVIVEGQFDVIKLHQEGIKNVVAASGTALSAEQIEQLARRSGAKTITLAFDGDAAGEKAARKALEKMQSLVLSETITLRILSLEPGVDPDSYCQEHGAEATRELFAAAPNWVEWWLDRELAAIDLDSIESVQRAEAGVKRILSVLPRGPQRSYVERRCADALGAAPAVKPAAPVVTKKARDARKWAERRALRTYLLIDSSREQLHDIDPSEPPFALGWQLVKFLEASTRRDQVAPLFGRAIKALPEDEFHELRSLLQPVPEVLSHLKGNPAKEVEDTLNLLAVVRKTATTTGATS